MFKDRRDALAYADAHGGQAALCAAAFHFVKERRGYACTAAAEWVAKRDGAAVDVYARRVYLKLVDTGNRLGGEGLVQLDQINVIDRQSSTQ